MPRPGTHLAGILAVLAAAGCSVLETLPTPSAAPSSSPSVAAAPYAAWAQDLSFGGDLTGTMGQVLSGDPGMRSECTGRNSLTAGTWASNLFGYVGSQVYGVTIRVAAYRGPGSYAAPGVTVQVHRPDNSAVWQTSSGDAATFTVATDQESGTVDATLTNLATTRSKLALSGRWSCRS